MNFFLANILLGLTWSMATGRFSLGNFAVGFVLGYFMLWFSQRELTRFAYFGRVPRVIKFLLRYLLDVILANLRVAYDVVTPTHYMRPGVIAVPLDAKTDGEITLLSNLLTLTPGTLSLDLSPDRKLLYIHAMYIDEDDAESVRRDIKENLEKRVLQVLR